MTSLVTPSQNETFRHGINESGKNHFIVIVSFRPSRLIYSSKLRPINQTRQKTSQLRDSSWNSEAVIIQGPRDREFNATAAGHCALRNWSKWSALNISRLLRRPHLRLSSPFLSVFLATQKPRLSKTTNNNNTFFD